jgi:hypothetical protein
VHKECRAEGLAELLLSGGIFVLRPPRCVAAISVCPGARCTEEGGGAHLLQGETSKNNLKKNEMK